MQIAAEEIFDPRSRRPMQGLENKIGRNFARCHPVGSGQFGQRSGNLCTGRRGIHTFQAALRPRHSGFTL